MTKHMRSAVLLVAALGTGCLDTSTPTKVVTLHVSGMVRDQATGAAIAGADVVLAKESDLNTSTTLLSVQTGANGQYALTYELDDVGADPRLADQCAVWEGNSSHTLSVEVSRHGYAPAVDGTGTAAALRCVNEPQVIDFALTAATPE